MNFISSFLTAIKPQSDDDAVDRLNYYWTCIILLLFSLTISAKQYVGQPIQCWVPAQFTDAWEQYAENYCFVQNTYWLPLQAPIPRFHDERDARQIGYYQWVPFVLAVEAFMFYFPCVFWRQLNWQSGIGIKGIIKMAEHADNLKNDERAKMVEAVTQHLEDAIGLQTDTNLSQKLLQLFRIGKRKGVYVSLLYLVSKTLYLLNVVLQFFLLNSFLGPRYRLWGVGILNDLLNGREWADSGHFPRVTMCDFEVRVLGNLHRYTIQCVLMINMFNEKIFVFLWWWFALVTVANTVNLAQWLLAIFSSSERAAFVGRFVRGGAAGERGALAAFVCRALRPDGVLVLRMVAAHSGDLVTTDIVSELWRRHRRGRRDGTDDALLERLHAKEPLTFAFDDATP